VSPLCAGGKRSNWESSGGSRKTLNQLLTDMDGFEENSGVVVMAATNLPELLDTALTRPGRFDRQVGGLGLGGLGWMDGWMVEWRECVAWDRLSACAQLIVFALPVHPAACLPRSPSHRWR
jgi:hypothetical protein